MFTFFVGVTIIEMIVFGLVLLGLLFAVFVESKDDDWTGLKWFLLVVGLVFFGLFNWSAWTFAGLFALMLTAAFWVPVGYYILAGFIYSVVEFFFESSDAQKDAKAAWEDEQDKKKRNVSYITGTVAYFNSAHRGHFIALEDGADGKPQAFIKKGKLFSHVSVWTIYWPFYLLVRVFDDIIDRLLRMLSDFIAYFGKWIVKFMFRNTFK